MSQSGYTPILIYGSTTSTNVPLAANLTTSANGVELAVNAADGKLFYKDGSGVVQVLATKGTGPIGGSTTQVQYNNGGVLAGSANLTFNGTTLTANTLNLTNALGAVYGGTAQSTYITGDTLYSSAANTLAKLAGNITSTRKYLMSVGDGVNATAPTWDQIDISTSDITGTLAVTNGGTGVTTSTGTGNVVLSASPTFTGTITAAAGSFTSLTASTTLGVTGVATFSAGTVSLPAIARTGNTNTGMWFPATDTIAFSVAGVESIRTNSNGITGFGSSPQFWVTAKAIQIGTRTSISQLSNNSFFTSNAYYDGTQYVYIAGTFATQYSQQSDGSHKWFTAPSGINGDPVTFTSRMTLASTGLLTVTGGATIQGLTVGKGNNAVGTNTAFGDTVLSGNTTGSENVGVGYNAMLSNLAGVANTALGAYALATNGNGYFNTAVGRNALYNFNYDDNNTAIGNFAGGTLTDGSNNSFLGNGAQPSNPTMNNEITLGNGSVIRLRCAVTTITSSSDARDKYDIEDLPVGLGFINSLRARRFKWDKRDAYFDEVQNETGPPTRVAVPKDGSRKSNEWNEGFIAQEVDEAATAAGADWMQIVYKSNPERLEMAPGKLIPVLVKAIQELTARLEALEAK